LKKKSEHKKQMPQKNIKSTRKMKKIKVKNVIIAYVVLIIIQFIILAFSKNVVSVGYEVKKGEEVAIKQNPELYERLRNSYDSKSNSYDKKIEEEFITKVAERIFVEELNRMQMDCNLRKNMGEDKEIINGLVQFYKDTINQIKSENPNSYKILEYEHQMEVVKKGYSPIQFFMEKILGLRSLDFLENQKNYFYMIITTILFLIVLGLKLSRNLKF
jgi:accessory gene regulator protein AgrB